MPIHSDDTTMADEEKTLAAPEKLDKNAETFSRNNVDPAYLSDLRLQMLKFARLHLQDEAGAEDAVQEALIGALKNAQSFSRRSALKTWVFAILKNKITDVIRQQQRHGTVPEDYSDNQEPLDETPFDDRGHWAMGSRPTSWQKPLESVKNDQFWRVFEACLDRLPPKQARLFMMREFLEFDSEDICQTMNITTSNLHVMLYRARLRLRACLETCWFAGEEGA